MTSLPDTNVSPETILIVDDREEAASLLESILEGYYTTRIAHRGSDAIDIIRHQRVDLVLLDILMPDMNGIEAAEMMKKFSGNDFLPIILVSALSSETDKVQGLKFADDYLTKPFASEELLARVNGLLRIRRLNRELSLSKARYMSLYENFPHLYLSIDSRRTVTNCNRSFRETFGLTMDEIIGKNFITLFREGERKQVENFLNSFSLTKNVPSIAQRTFAIVRDGTAPLMHLKMKAVYTGDADDGLNIVIAMEDITEQVRLQEEQRMARNHLYRSARLASIGTLASGVAHEINNPLTAILGCSSSLLGRNRNNEDIEADDLREYLEIINVEALRCRDIIDNLSNFAHDGDVQTTVVNLKQCIDNAVKLTHSSSAKAKIRVISTVEGELMVRSNANKLEQVFVHIITNCIDFCPGSTVTISEVSVKEEQRYCRISISDDGPGISPDVLPKVYDPFFTTKEVGMGTGMGLAICYKIMEECNGHIDIDSEPGSGTTVFLDFQIA